MKYSTKKLWKLSDKILTIFQSQKNSEYLFSRCLKDRIADSDSTAIFL